MRPKTLKFKPYARLLTMLGDQLIKNERVALVEVIKNAYDADAEWVKVTFEGFDHDFRGNATSKIIIEDDGSGMGRKLIENDWVSPATPVKRLAKKQKRGTTKKLRVIQGEKGIGRFALLKIGRKITITTREAREVGERVLVFDVSGYDDDFMSNNRALKLDDIDLSLREIRPAKTIIRKSVKLGLGTVTRKLHGTRIEISHLQAKWTREKVGKVYDDLARLQSIVGEEVDEQAQTKSKSRRDSFEIFIDRDGDYEPFSVERRERLQTLLAENAIFTIEGEYHQDERVFDFTLNGRSERMALADERLTGLTIFRKYYGKGAEVLKQRGTKCGSFSFKFYVFDFNADTASGYHLEEEDKQLIKQHRIYLYRDGIRVYPYGDPDDDWLQIDIRRGTVRASEFLSNDQVVGVVNITQAENPDLRDKTSREGLIEIGDATDDFRALLQSFLAWVRKDPYTKLYLDKNKTKDAVGAFQNNVVKQLLEKAEKSAESADNKETLETLRQVSKQYSQERNYLVQRAETTEHLAGVGLSVEAASHDLMLAMGQALTAIDGILQNTTHPRHAIDAEYLNKELHALRGLLGFIESQMKNVQQLFRSTKQRRKNIRVQEILEKVHHIYRRMLTKTEIEVEIEVVGASPLSAKTTEAVLLQLFLNLFDNSIYWLESVSHKRKIAIRLDGDRNELIFADNGPGIRDDDLPYIFEPFFSGKGEDGRGLGLYIARQLLDRQNYSIDVADKTDRILGGANFIISFVQEEGK